MDKLTQRLITELDELRASKNLRSLPTVLHHNERIERDGMDMLNLSSNDYLGLAVDRTLREHFLQSLTVDNFIPSSSSSRLLTGNFMVYDELETLLAEMYGKESSLVFNCGYHANTGILPALTNKDVLIIADKLVHASLIDGLQLSNAPFIRFRHNDYHHLEKIISQQSSKYTTIIVVVESIYSMDGDLADLTRLVALKKQYPNLWLYVDEAHGVGVRGSQGLGLAEEVGVMDSIDLLVGTCGKALSSTGAFVVCSRTVREYLINKMRPFIFTTALPPINIAWTLFVMKRLKHFDQKRKHLQKLAKIIASCKTLSTQTVESHIIPIVIGESSKAVKIAERLRQKGFYVLPVRPPTVPVGTARLRISLTAAMTETQAQELANCIDEIFIN